MGLQPLTGPWRQGRGVVDFIVEYRIYETVFCMNLFMKITMFLYIVPGHIQYKTLIYIKENTDIYTREQFSVSPLGCLA